jgi:hypothetical protein
MYEERPIEEEPEIYEYEDETRHRPVVTMEEQAFEQMLNVNNQLSKTEIKNAGSGLGTFRVNTSEPSICENNIFLG